MGVKEEKNKVELSRFSKNTKSQFVDHPKLKNFQIDVNERRTMERRVFAFEIWNGTKENEGITVVRLCV